MHDRRDALRDGSDGHKCRDGEDWRKREEPQSDGMERGTLLIKRILRWETGDGQQTTDKSKVKRDSKGVGKIKHLDSINTAGKEISMDIWNEGFLTV